MKNDKKFNDAINNTTVLKFPKHSLSTFGNTNIHYYLLTDLNTGKSKIREGQVISEKPEIITPRNIEDMFEGFGKKSGDYADMLLRKFGSDIRILEYRFKNSPKSSSTESKTIKVLSNELKKMIDEKDLRLTAIIKGPESMWQVSLMKFIVDMTMKSIKSNVTELAERGFFENPDAGISKQTLHSIEEMFKSAKHDRTKLKALGTKLQSLGLFEEYQDRFFSLLNK